MLCRGGLLSTALQLAGRARSSGVTGTGAAQGAPEFPVTRDGGMKDQKSRLMPRKCLQRCLGEMTKGGECRSFSAEA